MKAPGLFLVFALLLPAVAQEKKPTPQEALQAALGSIIDFKFDQPYAGNANPKQMVDLMLPKKPSSDKPLPVVVYIHGGGWVGGDRKGSLGALVGWVKSGNYAGVAVGYRLSNEAAWPAQIHDCKAAIRWIRGHAKEYNLDPDKICVQGASAGGHLVTLLGLTADNAKLNGEIGEFKDQSTAVTCVVNLCGPSDLTQPLMQGDAAKVDDPAVAGLIGGELADKLEVAKEASPINYVRKDAPPILTVHGTADLRVDYVNATNLDEALKKAGAPSLLIPVTNGGHGINGGPELIARIVQFVELHLRGVPAEISTAPIETVKP